MATADEMTIAEFIDFILQTEIAGPGDWIEKYRNIAPPKVWETYARRAITEESLSFMLSRIVQDVSSKINGDADANHDLLRNLRLFLTEVRAKSVQIGLEAVLVEV